MARKYGFYVRVATTISLARYRCCHENIKSIFPRHREMFCLLYIWTYFNKYTMTIKIGVLKVKNSFLTKTADAETRYKTQHTSHHVRKTLKCLLVSTCFVFLFNSTNLELAAILKTTTIKKAGNVKSPPLSPPVNSNTTGTITPMFSSCDWMKPNLKQKAGTARGKWLVRKDRGKLRGVKSLFLSENMLEK